MQADAALATWEQYFKSAKGRAAADRYKGILIIAIVVAHNGMICRPLRFLDDILYQFHVFGFFFIALAARGFHEKRTSLSRLAVRYLIPFLWFVTACWGALLVARHFSGPSVSSLALALFTSSAPNVKTATGASLWWFLPTLLTFTALHYLVAWRIRWTAVSLAVLAVSWLLMLALLLTEVSSSILLSLPLGFFVALCIYPLAVLFFIVPILLRRLQRTTTLAFWTGAALILAILVAAEAYVISARTIVNVSELQLGQSSPLSYVLVMTLPVFINIAVFYAATVLRSQRLSQLGRLSLQIYLLHLFVQIPLMAIAANFIEAPVLKVAVGLVISAAAIATSGALGHILLRVPLIANLLFPRDANDLRHPQRSR